MGDHAKYDRQELIGKGSFGQVHKGVCVETGEPVAIKTINLEDAEEEIEIIQQTGLSELLKDQITMQKLADSKRRVDDEVKNLPNVGLLSTKANVDLSYRGKPFKATAVVIQDH